MEGEFRENQGRMSLRDTSKFLKLLRCLLHCASSYVFGVDGVNIPQDDSVR